MRRHAWLRRQGATGYHLADFAMRWRKTRRSRAARTTRCTGRSNASGPTRTSREQPTDEELATLHPELREALFLARRRLPFSISLVFPQFAGDDYARAVDAGAGVRRVRRDPEQDGTLRHRARFFPGDRPLRHSRSRTDWWPPCRSTEVLIDDQHVPYARELWLPLVWFLIR